jgi:hypothetical protein
MLPSGGRPAFELLPHQRTLLVFASAIFGAVLVLMAA